MARLFFALLLFSARHAAAADIEWGDVNILVTTDVHSWLAGHSHPDHAPESDADFGDVVSVVQRFRELAGRQEKDVFFFDNGDLVDGTGLDSESVFELVASMPYDALNCGNHELYRSDRIDGLASFADGWKGRYLTSNIVRNGSFLGAPYAVIRGEQNTTVLVLGFMYNMADHCDAVDVVDLNATLYSEWLAEALSIEVDAVVVLAHMDYRDALVDTIVDRLSELTRSSIVVLTGHSHVRGFRRISPRAAVFEAGHFADTLGFLRLTGGSIDYDYLEMNKAALGAFGEGTSDGAAMSDRVAAERSKMGLDTVLGCSSRTYAGADLWSLYLGEVLPAYLDDRVFVSSSGSLRYDLYEGAVTVDDMHAVEPFEDALWLLGPLDSATLHDTLRILNSVTAPMLFSTKRPLRSGSLPAYLATNFTDGQYDLVVGDFDRGSVEAALTVATGKEQRSTALVLPGETRPTDTKAWLNWAQQYLPHCDQGAVVL